MIVSIHRMVAMYMHNSAAGNLHYKTKLLLIPFKNILQVVVRDNSIECRSTDAKLSCYFTFLCARLQ